MVRLSIPVILAIASMASADKYPHLRAKKDFTKDQQKPGIPDKGSFSVEKGFKCTGGFVKSKGVGTHCEAGMKKTFASGASVEDITSSISADLMDQIKTMMPDQNVMSGDNDEMMALLDQEGNDSLVGKTIEFGGGMKADWGCKLTFEKNDEGKLSKKLECGVKYDSGMGKKPEPPKEVVAYHDE